LILDSRDLEFVRQRNGTKHGSPALPKRSKCGEKSDYLRTLRLRNNCQFRV
jgi:hypothetical protein